MSHVLRNYIRDILLEAKKTGDANLLSNQTVGFAAEHAVFVALGGNDEMLSDGRIVGPYSNASKKGQDIFNKIYEKMKIAARPSAKIRAKLGTCKGLLPPGAGTRPVDVESTTADIHVKYNDFKRLLGFQKEEGEKEEGQETKEKIPPILEPGSIQVIDSKEFRNTSAIYDASLSQFFETIQKKANSVYKSLDAESIRYLTSSEKAPVRAIHGSSAEKPRLGGRKKAKSFGEDSVEYAEFLALRAAYQNALKLVGRSLFYKILEENGFKETLLRDIENLIFKSKNKVQVAVGKGKYKPGREAKAIVFAKFKGPEGNGDLEADVTCKYYDYSELLNIGTGPGKAKNIAGKMVVKEFGGSLDIPAAATGAQKNAAKKSNRKIEKEAEAAGAIPDKKAPTTVFYQVVDIEDESKVYFEIEFRLDGDSHPPQLKTGKAIMKL